MRATIREGRGLSILSTRRLLPPYATAVPTRAAAAPAGRPLLRHAGNAEGRVFRAPRRAPKAHRCSSPWVPETGLVIPLSTDRLCPAGYECIAEIGWAVSVGFTYRWANGIGLGFTYEFWLLTGNGVYETTVPQSFLAVLQYSFLPEPPEASR